MSKNPVGYLRDATAEEVQRCLLPVADGFRVVVVDELKRPGSGWSLPDKPDRMCRMRLGDSYCRRPAVASLNRRKWPNGSPMLWAYCEDHLYGRTWVDGRLEHLVLARRLAD